MIRATANVLLTTALVVIGLVASAFQLAGLININVAHGLLLAAWIAAVGGVWTAEVFASQPFKKTVIISFITALLSGIVLYRLDVWMVRKAQQEQVPASVPATAALPTVSVARQLAEMRKQSTRTKKDTEPIMRFVPTENGMGAQCLNPPKSPVLNYWPLTFKSPAEFCHDYPLVDARLANTESFYPLSLDEYEKGVTAHAGQEIFVLIYINNGVANIGLDPIAAIAKDITITINTDGQTGATHYIEVMATGANVETIYGRKRINTNPNERLEIMPATGQVRDFTGTMILAEDLNIGNNALKIGDLGPDFSDALFIRYKVRIVSAVD